LVQAVVIASPTNAVTSAPGSIITIANSQLVNSALTGVAPVVLNGFYSILNTIYDRPSSTLVGPSGTGGSANSIDYFQYINADKFITQGGTSNQFVKGDGSLQSIIAATTGSNVFVGDQTITGSLNVSGSIIGSISATNGIVSSSQQIQNYNTFAVTASNNTYYGENTFTNKVTHTNGYVVLTQVSQSLNFVDDTAASAGGVPLGGLYRNGNFIVIRIV
jgi:hypothetical protein